MGWSVPLRRQDVLQTGAIAAACFGSAHLANLVLNLGLKASPVWFPAGVGLAALLLYGRHLWFGIALGIFSFGLSMGAPWGFATLAAIGSSLSAFVGAYLLERMQFQANLRQLRDVLGFVLLAGGIAPMVNATVNTLNTSLAEMSPWEEFANYWGTVWLGDSVGILVIAPVPLTWLGCTSLAQPAATRFRGDITTLLPRLPEFLTWLILLLTISTTVFLAPAHAEIARYPLEYLPFPLIGWAALRLGQRGTVLGSLLVSAIAILGLVRQAGPFLAKCQGDFLQAALLMQIYVGIITITALVLAAAIAERQQVENLLRINQTHLQRLAANLECRVQERTAELQQRMQELHDSNQVKDLLLHAVAHDLKTPIQGILMVLNKLHRRGEETITVTQPMLECMIQSNEKLLYLLNSLLQDPASFPTLAPVQLATTCLPSVTAASLERLAESLKANHTQVINLVEPNLPPAIADSGQIQQVIECLISNAIRHNAPGLTITLKTNLMEAPDRCMETVTSATTMVRYSVQDNGVGLPKEVRDRLFELHSRNAHNCHLTGIGLGLPRSRQIIAAHGGQIGVTSEPGEGATFWFTLPVAPYPVETIEAQKTV